MVDPVTLKLCLAGALQGGAATFMGNFCAYLAANDWPHTTDLAAPDYDALLVNAWTVPYRVLWGLKHARPALRLVQRVDGVAREYQRFDGVDTLQADVNLLADATIYQSAYSRAAHQRHGVITARGPIIHNPVNITRFTPRQDAAPGTPPQIISVSWSSNPLKGTWHIPALARQLPSYHFTVVGARPLGEHPPNLTHIPSVPHADLPEVLRRADIYLSLLENDACPNVILEALASGLPLVYLPSGGVPELVREAGLPLTSLDGLGDALARLLADYAAYARRAREVAETQHDPAQIFGRYLAVIAAAERGPLPAPGDHWRALWHQRRYHLLEQGRKWRRIWRGQQTLSGHMR